jgi:hypothetical protein
MVFLRSSPLVVIVLGLSGVMALAAGQAPAASMAPTASARMARAVHVREEGQLHFLSDNATTIIDTGRIHGTIPGVARVDFIYNGSPEVRATFIIRGPGGTIRGRARGRLSDPVSPAPSFRGSLSITGGSGRYARTHGGGELFGVFHRHGYGLTFQAIGTLRQ